MTYQNHNHQCSHTICIIVKSWKLWYLSGKHASKYMLREFACNVFANKKIKDEKTLKEKKVLVKEKF